MYQHVSENETMPVNPTINDSNDDDESKQNKYDNNYVSDSDEQIERAGPSCKAQFPCITSLWSLPTLGTV